MAAISLEVLFRSISSTLGSTLHADAMILSSAAFAKGAKNPRRLRRYRKRTGRR
jgi:hypothetical protein